MAFASDSTTARPLLPLVPFVFRPLPPVDDPRSPDELLEEIRLTIEEQTPELPPAARKDVLASIEGRS